MPPETRTPMKADALRQLVIEALEDIKAEDMVVLDVRGRTSVTDYMIIASGRSNRHVSSIADQVIGRLRDHRLGKIAQERSQDWVLLDAGDVVAHIMLPEARQLYQLEKFWSEPPEDVPEES